jgi:hypothetical protein
MSIDVKELYAAGLSRPAVAALLQTVKTADNVVQAGIDSAAGVKTAYESNANTNAFTDAQQTKLAGIETGATADQTNAEILAAWEAATSLDDVNLFLKTGTRAMTAPILLASYVVSGLPTATAGGLIYVSNESGGPVIAFADGTNWRRVTDRAIVS